MLKLNYQIEVNAPANVVWSALTEASIYRLWAKAFSPNSQFSGEWLEGEQVSFFDPDLGGTRAIIDRLEPNKHLEYHHVSIFGPADVKQIDSDTAGKWIGSRETFVIEDKQTTTLLTVTIETHPDFVLMFNHGWEKALPAIKLICEQQN